MKLTLVLPLWQSPRILDQSRDGASGPAPTLGSKGVAERRGTIRIAEEDAQYLHSSMESLEALQAAHNFARKMQRTLEPSYVPPLPSFGSPGKFLVMDRT
jgi:hypothetical protein